MKIYNYHPETNEFINTSEALESPLEPNVFLIPAFATDIKPLEAKENEVNIFENGKWKIAIDLRKEVASLIDENGYFLGKYEFEIGEDYGENIIEGLPPTDIVRPKFENGIWLETYVEFPTIEEKVAILEEDLLINLEYTTDLDFRLANLELNL